MKPLPEKLEALRRSISLMETGGTASTVPLGFTCADATLRGGLRHGALHEVYAGDASQCGAATGFASGFASRLAAKRTIAWITTEFGSLEYGSLSASGLVEIGLDPSRILLVRLPKAGDALRAAGDVLSCFSIGGVVLEVQGKLKSLDLTASRRLSLAASQNDIPVILLRIAAKPEASAAETRWLIHAATSPPIDDASDFGAPHFGVQLLRNRHGENGEWRIEWNCNDGLFGSSEDRRRKADSVRLAAAPADRPLAAEEANRIAV